MRQVWISKAGGPEVLRLRESPDPNPGPGEVRIRVAAAGVNFADVMARMGIYPDAPKPPCVVGYEVAGTVDAVGEGAESLSLGQEVLALTHFGGYSDLVCVPARQVYPRPAGMSARVGASFLVSYLTAYQLLIVMGSLKAGDRVLIQSAAGGVGLAALDICKLRGAVAIGLASPSKHEFLLSRGLAYAIDSRAADWAGQVRRFTGRDGLQIALDSQGGAAWKANYELLGPTGRLLAFGVGSLAPGRRLSVPALLRFLVALPRFAPIGLMNDNRSVGGANLGHLWDRAPMVRGWVQELLSWYDEGTLNPRLDREFRFDEAAAAHERLQSREAIGKVLLIP
jgi:synaptic vesicle membrane protein VAT-1